MSLDGLRIPWSSSRMNDPTADKVRAAQVRQLYSQSLPGIFAAMLSAVTLVVSLREVVPDSRLIAWVAVYMLLQAPRLSLVRSFSRISPQGKSALAWGHWFIVTTTASAFMWGVAGFLLFPDVSVRHQFLLALFIAGLSAAATVVYAPLWPCSCLAILSMLLPLSCRFYSLNDEYNLIIGSVILVFAIVLVLVAKQVYKLQAESLGLGFEKSELIDSLKQQVLRAERLNDSLRAEILHHQRTESALRESEERYRQLVQLSPDGIYVSVRGVIVFANEAGARILGFTRPNEIVGLQSVDLVDPQHRQAVEARMRRVYEEKRAVPLMEQRVTRPDGSTAYVEVAAAPINFVGEAASQVVIRDVTERKQAEAEIVSSHERLRYLMSSSPTVIYSVSPHAGAAPTFVSENVVKQFGFEPAEFKNNAGLWKSRIHPDDVPGVQRVMPVLRARGHHALEYRFLHRDGTYRWIRDEMNLVADSEDDGVEIVGCGLDITERKFAEQRLERSLEEKEVLLREIHHRVKNNLQVISSLLRLQARHITDEAHKLMFAESQNRLSAMVLIHELLYRSDNLARIDVRGYVTGLSHLLFSSFGVSPDRIRFQADVSTVSMSVDAAIPCGLVVNELVSNSLKYAFPHGRRGRIHVVLQKTDDTFEMTIADDGIGLPANIELANARTLGLRLVHTLIKQLQGEVTIRRTEGTEFRIRFEEVSRPDPSQTLEMTGSVQVARRS